MTSKIEQGVREPTISDEAIHEWFALTYSNYLVMPRSVLQSMPAEWQRQFVGLLNDLTDRCEAAGIEMQPSYWVRARQGTRFVDDPLADYSRGRRNVFREAKADAA